MLRWCRLILSLRQFSRTEEQVRWLQGLLAAAVLPGEALASDI